MPEIELKDVTLHYREVAGGPSAVVIVAPLFLSGASVPEAAALAEGLESAGRAILYDRRNTGGSSKPGAPYGSDVDARDLCELIEGLELAPVVAAGSLTACRALVQAAASRPELFAGIALSLPLVFKASAELPALQAALHGRWISRLFPQWDRQLDSQLYMQMEREAGPQALSGMIDAYGVEDIESMLPEVPQPALVLHFDSPLVAPEVSRDTAARLPMGSLHEIPDLGHLGTARAVGAKVAREFLIGPAGGQGRPTHLPRGPLRPA